MTKTSHHLDELLGQELKIQAKGILKEIQEVNPLIFEECYALSVDKAFV